MAICQKVICLSIGLPRQFRLGAMGARQRFRSWVEFRSAVTAEATQSKKQNLAQPQFPKTYPGRCAKRNHRFWVRGVRRRIAGPPELTENALGDAPHPLARLSPARGVRPFPSARWRRLPKPSAKAALACRRGCGGRAWGNPHALLTSLPSDNLYWREIRARPLIGKLNPSVSLVRAKIVAVDRMGRLTQRRPNSDGFDPGVAAGRTRSDIAPGFCSIGSRFETEPWLDLILTFRLIVSRPMSSVRRS
ncbi:MAG: hypothetical protein M2R45_02204 [Verrucomicrobia subdivision 3 bacterium]|nr:hypothetical protein [Limisphaerales bacterium]MCS1413779.1 hypothetical protein [Limisphaerales bacterium]